MKYTVITTFNDAGYKQYGQRMIQTFLQTWPTDVALVVYSEQCEVQETAPNLEIQDIAVVNRLTEFKTAWCNVPRANGDVSADPVRSRRKDAGKGFKWDAVRFAHKVYSIFHCANNIDTDWLIWMDADTVCHSPISLLDLERLCPNDRDLCFLGRRGKYSECGLYAMNLVMPDTRAFLQKFQTMYDRAETGIFTLHEWHDSYVFDAVRSQCSLRELDWSSHLITGEGHPLINSEWGAYLDHLKGARKNLARSKPSDLKVIRTEAYWQ
jgi:hypothetical protein